MPLHAAKLCEGMVTTAGLAAVMLVTAMVFSESEVGRTSGTT